MQYLEFLNLTFIKSLLNSPYIYSYHRSKTSNKANQKKLLLQIMHSVFLIMLNPFLN